MKTGILAGGAKSRCTRGGSGRCCEFALCLAPLKLHNETYTYRRIQHIHPPSGIHHPQSLERDLDVVTVPCHTFTISLVNVSILQEHHSWMLTPLQSSPYPHARRESISTWARRHVFPMFAENISWVGVTTNVVKPCDTGRYGIAGTVERQSIVALL